MKLGVENKTFGGDVDIIFNALKNGERFAFSKYADLMKKVIMWEFHALVVLAIKILNG